MSTSLEQANTYDFVKQKMKTKFSASLVETILCKKAVNIISGSPISSPTTPRRFFSASMVWLISSMPRVTVAVASHRLFILHTVSLSLLDHNRPLYAQCFTYHAALITMLFAMESGFHSILSHTNCD